MSGLRSKAGLLTREERLVFLTVSLCLMGGGIFHAALSLFDLPDELDPRAAQVSARDDAAGGGSDQRTDASPSAGAAEEVDAGQDRAGPEASAAPAGVRQTPARGLSGRLELNSATRAELEELPGIGPALAGRILEHRARIGRFKRVEDLLDVNGIGEKTLSRFRDCVYVSIPGK